MTCLETLWQRREAVPRSPESQDQSVNHETPFLSYQQSLALPAALSIGIVSDLAAVLSLQSRSLEGFKGYAVLCSAPLLLCCDECPSEESSLPELPRSLLCSLPALPPAQAGRRVAPWSLTQLRVSWDSSELWGSRNFTKL